MCFFFSDNPYFALEKTKRAQACEMGYQIQILFNKSFLFKHNQNKNVFAKQDFLFVKNNFVIFL